MLAIKPWGFNVKALRQMILGHDRRLAVVASPPTIANQRR